ncbi:MAG: HAMP domain-containing sensor histidine kinase [Hyphomicrobium sp.]
MKAGSLKLRLLVAASLSLLAALILIGGLLVWVFERHVRDRMASDLTHQLDQLAALATPAADGSLTVVGEMTDPRFDQPLGGLYWQIDRAGHAVTRSRSLWDTVLTLPASLPKSLGVYIAEVTGPGGTLLVAAMRDVRLHAPQGGATPRTYRLTVATALDELEAGRRGLIQTLAAGLSIAFLGLVLAAWVQVRFGLKPLEAIRRELAQVRTGRSHELQTGGFPGEVLPLANEINRFLALQRDTIERARRRAGDLAHGLKTPLAAITAQADELRRLGNAKQALVLEQSIETMRRHVERQLALARSQGGQDLVSSVIHRIGGHIGTTIDILQKLPAGRPLQWIVTGELEAAACIEKEDFDEIMGNILDNARKWASTRILVTVTAQPGGLHIEVSDDGLGIAAPDVRNALQRGARLDERVQGSGLGLSIVQAILESYGSELRLARAAIGGLAVSFLLRAAAEAP